LLKINLNGELLWQQCFGSNGGEAAGGFCILNDLELMFTSSTSIADGDVDCDLYPSGFPPKPDLWMFRIFDTLSLSSPEPILDPSSIIIYPNPANDIIYYYVKETLPDAKLLVYSTYGRNMGEYRFERHQNQIEIDVSHFPSGVYVSILFSDSIIIDRRQFVVK